MRYLVLRKKFSAKILNSIFFFFRSLFCVSLFWRWVSLCCEIFHLHDLKLLWNYKKVICILRFNLNNFLYYMFSNRKKTLILHSSEKIVKTFMTPPRVNGCWTTTPTERRAGQRENIALTHSGFATPLAVRLG